MSKEEWQEHRNRCAIITTDQKRRRCLNLGGVPSEGVSGNFCVVGSNRGGQANGFRRSKLPSSPGFFTEPPLSKMHFTLEFGNNACADNPTSRFTPVMALRCEGFHLDLNSESIEMVNLEGGE
jgi:hypothetical protein